MTALIKFNGSDNLQKEFDKKISEFKRKNFEATQKGLTYAADNLSRTLARNSPGNGRFKRNWKVENKYANSKYIHNTRLTEKGIPLSNLIEYSRNNTPFIFSTFERNKEKMFNDFIKYMKNNL